MNGLVVGLLASAVGMVMGSYLTTASLRAARGESAWSGRSHCDACGVTLGFHRTTPVLSFLVSRGACRDCGAAIDPTHTLGELAGGAILGLAFVALPPIVAGLVSLLGLVLLASAVYDARTRRLPNVLTLAAAVLILILDLQHGGQRLVVGSLAAGFMCAGLTALRWAYARHRSEPGIGFGDVKLLAALALWLGVHASWMVVIAAVIGLSASAILRPADGKLAFGPAVAVAGWTIGFAMEAGWWGS